MGKGLFHYKPGENTMPAGPMVEFKLWCMDACLNLDLGISGGSEKWCTTPTGGKELCHGKTSRHYSGDAADISYRMNPGIKERVKEVMCCAKVCGFKYGKIEKDHFHLQTTPGIGGSKGALP